MKFVTTLRQISEEEFKEEEHPRKEDGKFASKGSGSNGKGSDLIKAEKIYDKTINATSFEETHKNLVDTVRNSSIKLENKMALNRIIKNWDLIQEKIAKDKGLCVVDDHGNYQTSSPTAVGQNELAGKDPNQMENVCSSSAKTLKKYVEKTPALKQFKIKSEIVRGNYLGKGKSHNIANRMYGDRIKAITDKNKDDNNVTKWLYDKGYKEWHGGIQHEWLKLDDGTIIDGAFGQMLPNKVENMYQRLVIITPDDPRQKWYIDHEWGVPENKDDWHLFGLESEFKEEEHPREEDGKFADKGTGSVGKKDTDISRSLSTRMGRGTMDLGSQVVIEQYNKENPDSQVEIPSVLSALWQPFEDYDPEEELERFEENIEEWKSWLDQNPQVKKVFDDMQVEVDEYNKILDDKFKNAKTFYSGMGIAEFSGIQVNQEMEESENYSFKSFSMSDADVGFNWGIVVEYDSDFIKKSGGKKVEYTTDILPTMSIHTNFDFIDDGGGKGESIENADSKLNSLFADEQEIRLSNDDASVAQFDENSIKSVTFDFGKLTIDKFMSRFFEEEDEVGEKGKKIIDSFKKHNGSLLWVEQNWNDVVDALREYDEHFSSSWLKNTEYKFKYKPQGLIHRDIKESFKEEEHPREDDGKFATKGSGSSSGHGSPKIVEPKAMLKTTKDFLNKWLSDVSMQNTKIYDNLLSKGGLSTSTFKTKTKTEVTNRLAIGIKDKNSNKDWDEAEQIFLQALEDNPEFKKVFKEYEGEVNEQNKMLQKKFESSEAFYRGTSIDELDAIFGEYSDKYSNYKWSSRYPFKSLSMNYDETLTLYNAGMMIHFNADSIRNQVSSTRVNYNAKPTKYVHASVDSSIDQNKIENTKSDNPAFMMDEEEVRVDNSNMGGIKVDKLDIFLSSDIKGTINILVDKFGITNDLPKWNEFIRMTNNYSIGGTKNNVYFKRIKGKDANGDSYTKALMDRKTGKLHPNERQNPVIRGAPVSYRFDNRELKKEIASNIQKELMRNKLFRSKVGDVTVK